jgi:hypothetical protein
MSHHSLQGYQQQQRQAQLLRLQWAWQVEVGLQGCLLMQKHRK